MFVSLASVKIQTKLAKTTQVHTSTVVAVVVQA